MAASALPQDAPSLPAAPHSRSIRAPEQQPMASHTILASTMPKTLSSSGTEQQFGEAAAGLKTAQLPPVPALLTIHEKGAMTMRICAALSATARPAGVRAQQKGVRP